MASAKSVTKRGVPILMAYLAYLAYLTELAIFEDGQVSQVSQMRLEGGEMAIFEDGHLGQVFSSHSREPWQTTVQNLYTPGEIDLAALRAWTRRRLGAAGGCRSGIRR
jgi:hypothetical protein